MTECHHGTTTTTCTTDEPDHFNWGTALGVLAGISILIGVPMGLMFRAEEREKAREEKEGRRKLEAEQQQRRSWETWEERRDREEREQRQRRDDIEPLYITAPTAVRRSGFAPRFELHTGPEDERALLHLEWSW